MKDESLFNYIIEERRLGDRRKSKRQTMATADCSPLLIAITGLILLTLTYLVC